MESVTISHAAPVFVGAAALCIKSILFRLSLSSVFTRSSYFSHTNYDLKDLQVIALEKQEKFFILFIQLKFQKEGLLFSVRSHIVGHIVCRRQVTLCTVKT